VSGVELGPFTWTAAGAWASFLALLGIIARQVGPWRKISIDAETVFRDGLVERVQRLEDTLERERAQRDADREALRARHEAERSLDRHKIKNLQQCFDAMMMGLKATPDRVSAVIEHIERLRAEQLKAEAIESATIHAAAIQGESL
jgi:hypothetical protein